MITYRGNDMPVVFGRFNFFFSHNGRYGACLRMCDENLVLESWTLTSEQARGRIIPDVAVDRATHALPLNDGRILLFQRGGLPGSHRRELAVLQPTGNKFARHRLGELPARFGGYLLPSPKSTHLGFVVAADDHEQSTIWRLSVAPPGIEPVARVPGFLEGGVWLDDDAGALAINQASGNGWSGIAVDLTQGSWKRIWSMSDTSTDRILFYAPRSRVLIVSTTVTGEERIGWAVLGEQTVHFPETLHRAGHARQALAQDDRGERVLVHEAAGAISRLLVYTLADGHLATLAGPLGAISAPASWVGDLIRFQFSTPGQPPTLATLRLANRPRWSISDDPDPARPAQPQAELIELGGPAGRIEALAYGGPDWRGCEHLVVALHGGPLSAWRFEFEPLFQCLAAAGVAILAPNYRGSTGYGDEHLRAVVGNWGGPDLDDVCALGRSLQQERKSLQLSRPVLLGVSYGAFLALLAACHEPRLWSACVAIAPFLSGPNLHDSAGAAVRNRVQQLGGLRPVDDAIGPRDVLRDCDSLTAPLLLVHGTSDETIPVAQSRMLRRRLLELGRTEGDDFEYLEVDGDHAELVLGQRPALNQQVVRFCLARSGLDSIRRIGSNHGRGRPEPLPAFAGSGNTRLSNGRR
ncbi:MAG: alpha/beta fold hydrolase [Actinomycetota bacterium]|nr:alpha/beta fold hydrolase [Actinomycetota bacterium]